jgi:hypothetical protein
MVSVDCVTGMALDFDGFRHFGLVGCAVEQHATSGRDVVAVTAAAREAAITIFHDPMCWRQRNGDKRSIRVPIEVGVRIIGNEARTTVNVGVTRGFDACTVMLLIHVA